MAVVARHGGRLFSSDPACGREAFATRFPDSRQVSEEIRATLSAAVSKPKRKELVLVQFLEQPPKVRDGRVPLSGRSSRARHRSTSS